MVGDSVRKSLRDLAADRIGKTQWALTSNTFFREQLAPEAPVIALEAVVTHDGSGRRASRVALYGVDQRFYEFHQRAVKAPTGSEFLLSAALAEELQAKPDDSILVRVPRVSAIPTESLHGRREDPGRTIRGTLRGVVARNAMGEFSLRPQQGAVKAVFISLARLQRDLDLDGKANLALSQNPRLADTVRQNFQLADIGINTRSYEGRTMIEHQSMMLNDSLLAAVQKTYSETQPVFSYLANSIVVNGRELPYSLVTGMDSPEVPADDSIALNDWAAKDLQAKVGDPVQMSYYLWDPSGRLETRKAEFKVSAIVPVDPTLRELAPTYPGISDAESVSDWDPPFPMNLAKIRPVDEEYWDRYKATPKAFIRLKAAQNLWRSRYGEVTSVRVTGPMALDKLRSAIDPQVAGLAVRNVEQESRQASTGATDFSEYFLYFSFFLIVSALLLATLFFKLGLEQRASELLTLRAIGFSPSQIRNLHLREGLLLAVIGSALGSIAAIAYAWLILAGLGSWWIGAVGTSDLKLYPSPVLAVAGFLAGLVTAVAAIVLSLRAIGRSKRSKPANPRLRLYLGLAALVAALALLMIGGPGGFFGAGALLLTSALNLFSHRLRASGQPLKDVKTLGLRYASHRAGRSVLCAALIASATFLIIATDSFRRTGNESEPGFRFFGESSIPIYFDPNTSEGREALNLLSTAQSRWLTFRLRPGDDASCLNLYQPLNPRVLGSPAAWLKPEWNLTAAASDGSIPAAVDANSLQYVLHRKIGDVIEVGGAKLRIVEALHDSLFQGEIIISEDNFKRAFPEEQGYRVFLIDAPESAEPELEKALSDYGLDVTTTAARRAAFHQVENTYLSTFQLLGALGLLLGTIGLATILLRNVLERRRELGLLRAVGFTRSHLGAMILAENLLLLFTGVGIGIICAGIAVAPTAIQRGGTPPFVSMFVLLLAVIATGVFASWIALRAAVRSPFLDALRSD